MKMAAAEGICVDTEGAAFTIAQFGSCPLGDDSQPLQIIRVPGVASFMSHNSFTAASEGVADIQDRMVALLNADPDFTAKYGDASAYDFRPPQMAVFWSFRLMIGLGAASFALAAWGLWATRRGRAPGSLRLSQLALANIPMPFAAASFGWIFTEMGRQPWVVAPNLGALSSGSPLGSVALMTQMGVSPNVPAWQMLTTLILFTVLYGVLGFIWYLLMKRYALEGIRTAPARAAAASAESADDLAFGY